MNDNFNGPKPTVSGYYGGKWVHVNPEDFKPTILFEIIGDEYFQIKFKNLRDH